MSLFSQNPGKLDRRLQLLAALTSQDNTGGEVTTWVDMGNAWASWLTQSSREFFAAQAQHSEAIGIFRIRHRSDVITTWRVVNGDDTFDILGVENVGRRDYLDLIVRALDQSVGSPVLVVSARLLHDGSPRMLHNGALAVLHTAETAAPPVTSVGSERLLHDGSNRLLHDGSTALLESAA